MKLLILKWFLYAKEVWQDIKWALGIDGPSSWPEWDNKRDHDEN